MNKEEWKSFLLWLETASDEQLETRLVAVSSIRETLQEANARAEANNILKEIRIELSARRETKR